MKHLAYWVGRMRLAGMTRLLIGCGLVALGASLVRDGLDHMTPRSVYVHGYTRSDDIHVHSYVRRPPGGAGHDRPYEREISTGRPSEFIGMCLVGWFFVRAFLLSVRNLLNIPEVARPSVLSVDSTPTGVWFVRWPVACKTCGTKIISGEPGWFFGQAGIKKRGKPPNGIYCRACVDQIKAENEARRKAYIEADVEYKKTIDKAYEMAARLAYGRGFELAKLKEE